MIRILFYVLLIFAAAAGFVWLSEHPGELTFRFQNYEVSMTVMTAAIILIVVLGLLWLIWLILRSLFRAPGNLSQKIAAGHRDRGHHALSRGLVAVGSGDPVVAAHYAAEARRELRHEPLTLLLNAQAAQLAGDAAGTRAAYEAMLGNAETRILGLRGLFLEAERHGDPIAARSFATEAAREKPGLGWAASALLEFQARDHQWTAALDTLAGLALTGTIPAKRANRLRAVLLAAQAIAMEDGEPEAASEAALEAHRLAPELVPAAVVAARLLSRLNDPKRAAKVIEATWKIEPHPELADAYMALRSGDSGRERLRRMRALTKIRANHLEGQIALARAAIDAKDWATAREELKGVIATQPTERALMLMADIEEGEHGDIGRARDWLSRAVRAPADPAWIADGYAFDEWEPVSPISGRLDAFEWKAGVERLGPPAQPAGVPAPAVLPGEATMIEAEIVAVTSVPATQATEPASPPPSSSPPSAATQPAPKPDPAVDPERGIVRQPDDPGPEPSDQPPDKNGRRGLRVFF